MSVRPAAAPGFGCPISRESGSLQWKCRGPALSGAFSEQRTDGGNQPAKGSVMADDKSGPAEGISGVVEGVKGKAKETVGAVTGRDDLQREGQAQQDKADAQREAAKKEAEAESARGAAKASEAREKAEQ
jgi:uncharacterized protein YjbJ (UPF0337 family)